MISAAGHRFELDIPDKSGFPNRLLHEKAAERIRVRLENPALRPRPGDQEELVRLESVLSGPALPDGIDYLYGWFIDIASARSGNGFGPNALTAVEIAAWSQLSGHPISAWDFGMVRALDRKWLEIYAELHKPDPKKKPEPLD